MSVFQAVFLGALQGVTEFLPISSSGHLILIPRFFGWEQQGIIFDIAIHLATLSAVIIVFFKDIINISKDMIAKLALASAPVFVFAFLFSDLIESDFRSPIIVAFSLIFWGIVLGVADIYSKKIAKHEKAEQMSFLSALFIGIAQAIALIPGTSRSGITISSGLFSGLSRYEAARFSFLLAIPAILGSAVFQIIEFSNGGEKIILIPFIAGFISALIFGALSIKILLRFVTRVSFQVFMWYRIALGLIVLWALYV